MVLLRELDIEELIVGEPLITLEEAQSRVSDKTAPKVTEESIKAKIKDTRYFRHGTLTVCVIEMVNGYKVLGKAAPASPENYDQMVGQRYAYEDALKQLWHLEGYLLCEILYHKQVTA